MFMANTKLLTFTKKRQTVNCKSWSRGHFCRFPFAVNASLNLSNIREGSGRSDHVTMISPDLQFTVCRFLVKVSSFVLAINIKIILHHSCILIIYFEET